MRKTYRILAITVLTLICAFCITGCFPRSAGKAIDKLGEKGYTTETTAATAVCKGLFDDVERAVLGIKGADSIIIVYFDDDDDAKDAYFDISKIKDRYFANKDSEDIVSGRKGEAIYVGTKAAYNAVK